MDVFRLRDRLVADYADYVNSFVEIKDDRLRDLVERESAEGKFWPQPRIALNPSFQPGGTIDALVANDTLHEESARVFRRKYFVTDKASGERRLKQDPLNLYRHQTEAIAAAKTGQSYVLTTGTGSGKSLAYMIPIVDHVLRQGHGHGIQAIVVYPMNALANSQMGELDKFLRLGYTEGKPPVTFNRYTGQESQEQRDEIMANPPDILLTNYVMLELILTRNWEDRLVAAARGLRFLVLDELHTYRGRQGSDVAMLIRRVREACHAPNLQCVGTSATLAGSGTSEERATQVAQVASTLFGTTVQPTHVIGETLRRMTHPRQLDAPTFLADLRGRVETGTEPAAEYAAFAADPLSTWIETTLGVVEEKGTERLIRSEPLPLAGPGSASERLSAVTALPVDTCVQAIQRQLLAGYAVTHPETGFPVFAFRLHQFIGRGDTAYASLQSPKIRHLTLEAQRYVPGDREHLLYPVVFCRECGQEYLKVRATGEPGSGAYLPATEDEVDPDTEANGYLYVSDDNPWPSVLEDVLDRVPDFWVEEAGGFSRVRVGYRKYLPKPLFLDGLGRESSDQSTEPAWFVSGAFRFCLNCGVSHAGRGGDFSRVATLAAGGRSSATTLLCLEAVRGLREDGTLDPTAKKVLTFSDNRQDASLQAGHFNDFVQVGLLRAGLHQAVLHAGVDGLSYDVLVQRVFDELQLPLEAYAADPTVKGLLKQETERAFRDVLGYRVYVDLQRGWRLTSPNLEQCGLLEIDYPPLQELCEDEDEWETKHPALVASSPAMRRQLCEVLLDHLRRELAIKIDFLDQRYQEVIRQRVSQRLNISWRFDEDERPTYARVLFPRPQRDGDQRSYSFLSGRSGFGQYLRRPNILPRQEPRLKVDETEQIIRDLLQALASYGLVEIAEKPSGDDVPGYQLAAAAMSWKAGDGKHGYHDPVRIPRAPEQGIRPNPYFVDLYRRGVTYERGLEAHEHTAAVPSQQREEREQRFGRGELPLLFCSPTMELGVDVAQLNVVGLRNVPPTPANYAQRSGRAGRSGQPALVFTYCTTGSPHDQYYFDRPAEMVSGQVVPPRLDLTNEDLLRAHMHAIWLTESGITLGRSLKEVLDVTGEKPSLEVLASIRGTLRDPGIRSRAIDRCRRVLHGLEHDLAHTAWWRDGWLEDALHSIERSFDNACERWRSLYQAARAQRDRQDKIITDAARSPTEKERARRLRGQAEQRLQLLLSEADQSLQADFNSYRYFASEGFLPGYSFPRLPLSAYIPGRRGRNTDEYLQRPRFLAISEYGPRNLLYHEGSRYEIDRVMLRAPEPGAGDDRATLLESAVRCGHCGYLHPAPNGEAPDLCEHCGTALGIHLDALFRLQNVSTRRRDRINCDEEERQRYGYEVRTAVRFERVDGAPSVATAELVHDDKTLGRLFYGQAATVWRINLGWRRRQEGEQGFWIDLDSGTWRRRPGASGDGQPGDEGEGPRQERVIPYVEDRRNCLLFEPSETGSPEQAASLQWAIAAAIQVLFQLEDDELAAEPLPDEANRQSILFYEGSEGGAGVLRRLVEEPQRFAKLARTALKVCHFDPETGADRPEEAGGCEAACYRCLLSYRNQRDHRLLDRARLPELLLQYARADVRASPVGETRAEHLAALRAKAGSSLEREWLDWLEARRSNLPDEAQTRIQEAATKPDFLYRSAGVAVYVDGPMHEYPDRHQRDLSQEGALDNLGWMVVRFRAQDDWDEIAAQYPNTFGIKE